MYVYFNYQNELMNIIIISERTLASFENMILK